MWQESSNEAIAFTESSRHVVTDSFKLLMSYWLHLNFKIVKLSWFIMPVTKTPLNYLEMCNTVTNILKIHPIGMATFRKINSSFKLIFCVCIVFAFLNILPTIVLLLWCIHLFEHTLVSYFCFILECKFFHLFIHFGYS